MYRCKYIARDIFSIFTLLFNFSSSFVIEYATRNPLRKKNVSTDNSPDQTDIIIGSEYAFVIERQMNQNE